MPLFCLIDGFIIIKNIMFSRILILETLAKLPISNKTMLQDSKVLSTVQKWSEGCVIVSPNTDSGNSTPEVSKLDQNPDAPSPPKELVTLALKLLADWATLKEVFRIPKKERIQQMKEHEREADRHSAKHYKEDIDRSNRDR